MAEKDAFEQLLAAKANLHKIEALEDLTLAAIARAEDVEATFDSLVSKAKFYQQTLAASCHAAAEFYEAYEMTLLPFIDAGGDTEALVSASSLLLQHLQNVSMHNHNTSLSLLQNTIPWLEQLKTSSPKELQASSKKFQKDATDCKKDLRKLAADTSKICRKAQKHPKYCKSAGHAAAGFAEAIQDEVQQFQRFAETFLIAERRNLCVISEDLVVHADSIIEVQHSLPGVVQHMENVLRLSTSPHILPYIPALQEIVSPPQIERSDMDASMVSETHERTEEPTYSTPVRQPRPNLSKNDVAYDEASDAGQEADDQAVAETRQGVLPDEQRNGEGEDHVGELPPRSEKSSTKRNMARLESFEFDESYIDEDVDDYDDEGQQADLLMSETILNAPDMPAEPIGVTTQVDEDIRVSQTYPAQTAMVAAQRSVAEDIGNSIEIQQSTSGFDGLLMDDFFSEAPTDMVIPTPPPSVASTAFPPPPPPPPGSAPDLLNARIAMTNASEDWEPLTPEEQEIRRQQRLAQLKKNLSQSMEEVGPSLGSLAQMVAMNAQNLQARRSGLTPPAARKVHPHSAPIPRQEDGPPALSAILAARSKLRHANGEDENTDEAN